MLVAGFAVLVALAAMEMRRRQGLYWYDVRQDYVYDFRPGSFAAHPVDVDVSGFAIAGLTGRWDTALLRIEVSASFAGWWFEPCIEVQTAGGAGRQCFERGVKGLRYVLLPATALHSGERLTLRGQHLRWQVQKAELLVFHNADLGRGRVLVLAPHPDDAEIAAFGLYSGRESFVVTMTAGNYVDGLYAGVSDDPTVQDAWRGEVRSWDSLAVPQWGGVPTERVVNLGYATHSLPRFHAAARSAPSLAGFQNKAPALFRRGAVLPLLGGRAATAEWSSVLEDLAAVLSAVQPELIVAPHPALDAAPDHQYTTIALLEALKSVRDERAILLLYDNHHVLTEYFPFGPSDTRIGPPPWFKGAEFAGVYSLELDEATQLRKLFALDAMHDLRAPPLRLAGGPADILGSRLRQAVELVRRDPFGDYSYFRRAVRPNELFFVYRPGDRDALRKSLQ